MGVALKNPLQWLRPQEPEGRKRKPAPAARKGGKHKGVKRPTKATATRKGPASKGATRKVKTQKAEKTTRNFAWLNRILILLGAGLVIAAGVQAWVTLQSIPVQQITVTGELEHTRTGEVQEMVQPVLTGGFLGTDLDQVRKQLEALPWIYEASVRRVWPNALEIHVVEQLPIARWGEEGFLNHEGEVFRPSDVAAWQTLPLLQGPENTAPELMASYQRIGDILAPVNLRVEQLLVDERGQVQAMLQGGTQLVMGNKDFLQRMRRFVTIYKAELAAKGGEIERVDLRYSSGVAVVFREPSVETDVTEG